MRNYSPEQARKARKLIDHEQEEGYMSSQVRELWDRIGIGMTGRAHFYKNSNAQKVPHESRV